MPKLSERGAIQFIVLFILIAGIIGGVYLVQQTQIFKPKAGGGSISGPIIAGVGLTVDGGDFDAHVGQEVAVSVTARSDFDSANLFVAKLAFDKDLIRISRINTDTNFISNWVEQSYDNTTGEISLVGGIPTPGFQSQVGNAGHMATIYFVPLRAGSVSFSFTDESAIYRNSDNTNIIGFKNGATIPIYSGGATPTTSPTSTPTFTPSPSPITDPVAGDGNGDGRIDLVDLSILFSDFNKRSGFRSGIDLNRDGVINTFDFSAMRLLLIQRGVVKG